MKSTKLSIKSHKIVLFRSFTFCYVVNLNSNVWLLFKSMYHGHFKHHIWLGNKPYLHLGCFCIICSYEYLKLKNFEYLTNCMTNSKMSIYICCLFKSTISLGYSCSFFTKLKLFFFFGNQLHYYSQSCNAFVAHYRHACSMTKK